jgi:hypothetical protein
MTSFIKGYAMKTLFTFIGILLILNLSGQTEKRHIEFSGTISDKYPIKMFLSIQNNKVLGYYYYETYKTKILLEGEQKGTTMTLKESPDYDPKFSLGFKFDLKGKILSGTWIDSIKSKSLNVKMSIDHDTLVTTNEDINKIEGNYKNVYNSDKFQSSMILQNITNDLFCFEISIGQENCTGYLKGIIALTNFKNGYYTGNLCKKLQITIDSNVIIISEENCGWHGISCSFEGKYTKN